MDNITRADPNRVWTVREVAEHVGIGGIGPIFVGSPATVCDALERWQDATGIDGFNLCYVVAHETFEDVVEFVVPELQRRGRYPTSYREGTLRQNSQRRQCDGSRARSHVSGVGAWHIPHSLSPL